MMLIVLFGMLFAFDITVVVAAVRSFVSLTTNHVLACRSDAAVAQETAERINAGNTIHCGYGELALAEQHVLQQIRPNTPYP